MPSKNEKLKGDPKLQRKNIFMPVAKIGENLLNILNCYFSK